MDRRAFLSRLRSDKGECFFSKMPPWGLAAVVARREGLRAEGSAVTERGLEERIHGRGARRSGTACAVRQVSPVRMGRDGNGCSGAGNVSTHRKTSLVGSARRDFPENELPGNRAEQREGARVRRCDGAARSGGGMAGFLDWGFCR